MKPEIISALISAFVSISVVIISRWIFSRSDRRFPVLVTIQTKLLEMQKNPRWSTNGGHLFFERIPEVAKFLEPYFDQLRMVSFPRKNCSVQRAFSTFKSITEKEWLSKHPTRAENLSGAMSKDEFQLELKALLRAVAEG